MHRAGRMATKKSRIYAQCAVQGVWQLKGGAGEASTREGRRAATPNRATRSELSQASAVHWPFAYTNHSMIRGKFVGVGYERHGR